MRLFQRTREEKIDTLVRCHREAERYRIGLALARLADLSEEFPDDPDIVYTEGMLRKKHAGQGLAAHDLFERAYQLSKGAQPVTRTCRLAIGQGSTVSRNERELREWYERSREVLTAEDAQVKQTMAAWIGALDKGQPWWGCLLGASGQYFEAKVYGQCAALLEMALLTEEIPFSDEVEVRRFRAQALAALDQQAQNHRNTLREQFPAEERLALEGALAEIERALALDDHDPELWNLKSSWTGHLGRYEEAIACADKAIALRPHRYSLPYGNKAQALWHMERREEALEWARKCLEVAEAAHSPADISRAQEQVARYGALWVPPGPEQLPERVGHVLNAAAIEAEDEQKATGATLAGLTQHICQGADSAGGKAGGFITLMAQILSLFVPETVFLATSACIMVSPQIHARCLHGSLYIAAHSEGVMRRDAARFLALSLLQGGTGREIVGSIQEKSPQQIRKAYRELILAPAAAAAGEMSHLDEILREELARLNPFFPMLIADQEPIDEADKARAEREILAWLDGSQDSSIDERSLGMFGFDDTPPGAKCAQCGAPAKVMRKRTPQDSPFIRGDTVLELNPLSYCHDCGLGFCSQCKKGIHCPRCGQFLLATPPDNYRPGGRGLFSWLGRLFGR